jgi:dihydroneopterin aldolase
MKDRILLHDVQLQVHLGVPLEERASPQTISLDLACETDVRPAGLSDDFRLTVDYAALLDTAQEIAAARPYALVESLAEEIAAAVLARFPISSVHVLIRKPAALAHRGVGWAGVEIFRSRQ